jgi:hypothetical protein
VLVTNILNDFPSRTSNADIVTFVITGTAFDKKGFDI